MGFVDWKLNISSPYSAISLHERQHIYTFSKMSQEAVPRALSYSHAAVQVDILKDMTCQREVGKQLKPVLARPAATSIPPHPNRLCICPTNTKLHHVPYPNLIQLQAQKALDSLKRLRSCWILP